MVAPGSARALLLTLLLAAAAAQAQSPLLDAARDGREAAALRLLEGGADVGTSGPQGETALHWAAFNGQLGLARGLLARGADANARVRNGNTPLHQAAYAGHLEMVKLLLHHGASARAGDRRGLTPAQWAARNGHHALVRLLEPGARPAPVAPRRHTGRSVVLTRDGDDEALDRALSDLSKRLSLSRPPTTLPDAPRDHAPPSSEDDAPGTAADARPPATPEPPPADAGPAAWIQLGSFDTETGARAQLTQVTRAVPELARLPHRIVAADLAGIDGDIRRTFRLRVGPVPRSRARVACEQLADRRLPCLVVLRYAPD